MLNSIVPKNKYHKTYPSAAAQRQAFLNFIQTLGDNFNHNKRFDKGEETYRRALNQFSDLSHEQLQEIASGFVLPPVSVQGRNVVIVQRGTFPPGPQFVDWRAKGCVSPVKDQGFYCSACWAFSAIGALESHVLIKYGLNLSLSEQQLIDCNRNEVTGNWGCKGGSQGSAYAHIKTMGIQSTETYPYLDDFPHEDVFSCSYNKSNTVLKIKGHFRFRPKDEITLRDAVAARGPVAFAFNGSKDSFMYYENGIYDEDDCPR